MKTAINLFTLSDLKESHSLSEILELCADAGYDGVEFLHRFPEADLEMVKNTLNSTGLSVAGAHLGPFINLEDQSTEIERTIESYAAVNCGTLAISIGDRSHFESAGQVAKTARKLELLAKTAASYDIDFVYHNHHWEFESLSGTNLTVFDALMSELDDSIGVELDIGWVAAGGDNPLARIRSLGDRIKILHVKDANIAEKRSVEVGNGDVDIPSCIEASLESGVDWFIYEHDEPDDPIVSLETGAEYLSTF